MPYAYAGDYYRAGDNYPYRAGSVFSKIGHALGSVLKVAGGILPGPLGTISKVGGTILSGGTPTSTTNPILTMAPPSSVPSGVPGATKEPGITGIVHRLMPGGSTGYVEQAPPSGGHSGYHLNKSYSYAYGAPAGTYWVKNRHSNPGNARALRRALRREKAFISLARRALHGTGITIGRHRFASKAKGRRR